jgi:hypothetical protein
MADDIELRRRLSPSTSTYNIALRGLSSANRTTSVSAEVYWRDPNDSSSTGWKLLGEGVAGGFVLVPFDPKGRTIELSLIAKTEKGYRSSSFVDEGVRTLFTVGAPALTDLTFSAPDVTGTIANNGGHGNINVLRKLSTDTEFSAIQSVADTATTFTDTPAINGDYEYKLTQDGLDGESNTLNVTVTGGGGGAGTPPDGLSATFDGVETVSLSWTNHGGTGANIIEAKIGSSGSWSFVGSVTSGTNTFDDTETRGSTNYVVYYRVSNEDVSGYSNEDFVTIPREFL